MSIHNKEAYFASQWDWACLDECFGETRISPMDGDGCIERHGHVLFIETKRPGVQLPKGQQITLDALSRKPGVTVLIVWGEPGAPERIRVMGNKGQREWEPAGMTILRDIVSKWFTYANREAANG